MKELSFNTKLLDNSKFKEVYDRGPAYKSLFEIGVNDTKILASTENYEEVVHEILLSNKPNEQILKNLATYSKFENILRSVYFDYNLVSLENQNVPSDVLDRILETTKLITAKEAIVHHPNTSIRALKLLATEEFPEDLSKYAKLRLICKKCLHSNQSEFSFLLTSAFVNLNHTLIEEFSMNRYDHLS